MGASGDVAAFVVFDVGPCVEAGTGVFTTGDLTFGVVRDVEGCVTAVLTFGGASLACAGTMGGGTEGFTLEIAAVFSGVAGGGTGTESEDETSAGGTGGGSSVSREHAFSPNTTATIKQIRVDNINVTPSHPSVGTRRQ